MDVYSFMRDRLRQCTQDMTLVKENESVWAIRATE
jgi:hypothetical protein